MPKHATPGRRPPKCRAWAGVTRTLGKVTLTGAAYHVNVKNTAANADADPTMLVARGMYALSKRTTAYTSYGKIGNDNGAGYTVGNNTDVGSGDSAFNVGVRHTF